MLYILWAWTNVWHISAICIIILSIFTILKCDFLSTDSLTMAQVEKRGGLLRKSSASKKPLKEKVVLMYDEIFMVRPAALLCTAWLFSFLVQNEKYPYLCLLPSGSLGDVGGRRERGFEGKNESSQSRDYNHVLINIGCYCVVLIGCCHEPGKTIERREEGWGSSFSEYFKERLALLVI